MMKPPKSYQNTVDLDYSPTYHAADDDLLKYKRTNLRRCWRRYSKAFLISCGLLCFALLSIYSLLLRGNRIEKSKHGGFLLERKQRVYKLMIVADLDKESLVQEDSKGIWRSILKKAELRIDENNHYSIHWLEDQEVFSKYSEAGRGMELSALLEWNNRLYTFDDRTGIVYELIKGNKAIPRHILMEGNGDVAKGQKSEWATIKDNKMYVGSFGKEYTDNAGKVVSTNNMWISIIDSSGHIEHRDWTKPYNALRQSVGAAFPGYMIHEAVAWSTILHHWVILPRRVSKTAYNEKEDESRGSNLMLLASEDFKKIQVKKVATLVPARGFSDFKFLPESGDRIIVALKSEEREEEHFQTSYITVFDIEGTVLLEEEEIPGHKKFEGLEFFFF